MASNGRGQANETENVGVVRGRAESGERGEKRFRRRLERPGGSLKERSWCSGVSYFWKTRKNCC